MHGAAHAARRAARFAENLRNQSKQVTAQREQVRMRAMSSEYAVAVVQRSRNPDRDRFLADRKMTGRFRKSFLHERADCLFRETNLQHVAQELQKCRWIDASDIERLLMQ
jgi:hypothetical protein